jgi:hypothetical protein
MKRGVVQIIKLKAVYTLLVVFFLTVSSASAQTIWSDNFDNYAVGEFPSSGGWSLIYSGAGVSYQYVDNIHSVSGTQSLHLVGSSCWGAQAYNQVAVPSQVTFEAMVFIDQIVNCGCTPTLADAELFNPNQNTWGTGYGTVKFNCDGNLYASQSYYDGSQDVMLMPYSAGAWYHIRSDVDLDARLFDVYINDTLVASTLHIIDTGLPTGVQLTAGHGDNPTVWFDDVKVSDITPAAAGIPLPSGQNFFPLPAVESPVVSLIPSEDDPIGVGPVATGGNVVNVQVALGQFSAPVDIYFGIAAPAIDPVNIYLLTPTGLQTLAQAGLVPWMSNTTGNIDVSLFGNIPISQFPPGTYTLYLDVTPAGSTSTYYLWETNFTVATVANYTMTGMVTLNGTGLSGVTVSLSGGASTTTDSSGSYSFSVANGGYTVTPSLMGYTFSPTSMTATVSGANVTVPNFTATSNSGGNPDPMEENGLLQGSWYYNSGNNDAVGLGYITAFSFVSANDGYPEGTFTTDPPPPYNSTYPSNGNYWYNIDDTGTLIMFSELLNNNTEQLLLETTVFEVTQSMLTMQFPWGRTAYYCKGSPNSCTP